MTSQISLAALGLCFAVAQAGVPCPVLNERTRSVSKAGGEEEIVIENRSPFDVTVWWVTMDDTAEEMYSNIIGQGDDKPLGSYPGHIFRIRTMVTHAFVEDIEVKHGVSTYTINGCDEAAKKEADHDKDTDRGDEFEALVDKENKCVGTNDQWSCTKMVSVRERNGREKKKYGFHPGENQMRGVGAQEDFGYVGQEKDIPALSSGPGYLKMKMTDVMKQALYPWYDERKKDSVEEHDPIGGGYTNNNLVSGCDRDVLQLFSVFHDSRPVSSPLPAAALVICNH
jgi:hypothetical protein